MRKITLLLVLVLFIAESYAQRTPVRDPYNDPCYNTTTLLWGVAPYENVVTLGMGQIVTFKTNKVCGASSYIWTTMDGFSITTAEPQLTISSRELLWLPPSGCDGFNARISNGAYNTTMSVKSNISNTVTIPVAILGVEECEEGSLGGGGTTDGGGSVPGSFTGCCN